LEIQSSEDGMVDIEFLEEHDILNTDSKDVMSAVLMEGDGLEIEKRHEDGLIPRVVHRSSEKGRSKIIDDKMEFVFEDNEFVLIPPTSLEGDVSGKYQSVALELETDAPNINYKLRVNSYRQFAILSENDEELVTWNHNGLPVSALTEDNELQTLAQMREKYPGLEFEILPEKTVVGLFSILTNDYDEENFPPYLLYLTDVSLQSNPLLVEKLPELKFRYTEDSYLGVSQFESITIGREFVDFPELSSYNFSRGQRSPLQLLTHEYEHLFDINIKSLEQESFGWAGYVDESRDDSEIISFLRSLEDPELDSLIDDFYSSSRTSEKRGVAEQIENFYKSKYSSLMTLQQHYNQIVLHGIRNSIYNSDFVSSMSDILGNIDTTQFPEGVSGRTLHALEYVEEKLNDEDISAVDVYFSLNFLEKAIREEENLPKSVIPMDEIRQTVFRNTGLPAIYASYDPIDPGPFTMFKGDFVELQTTYREQTVEQRKVLAQSANPLVSNVYRRLTQLAFDSGKMPIEEFLEIMDEGFCERSDCLDKRCVEYKLLCCDRSPNSPNC
jgi:hypothetical protein